LQKRWHRLLLDDRRSFPAQVGRGLRELGAETQLFEGLNGGRTLCVSQRRNHDALQARAIGFASRLCHTAAFGRWSGWITTTRGLKNLYEAGIRRAASPWLRARQRSMARQPPRRWAQHAAQGAGVRPARSALSRRPLPRTRHAPPSARARARSRSRAARTAPARGPRRAKRRLSTCSRAGEGAGGGGEGGPAGGTARSIACAPPGAKQAGDTAVPATPAALDGLPSPNAPLIKLKAGPAPGLR
jgi:hypothetical protein